MNSIVKFIHEGDTEIIVSCKHKNDPDLLRRVNHEIMFRKIIYECIENKVIDINKNMIDSGSWIGDNTLCWAKIIKNKGGSGIVYSIDPSQNNKEYIESVAALNNLNNIKCYECALSDKVEELNYEGSVDHNSFIECGLRPYKGNNFLMSTSIDIMLEQKQIENVDFIHLDVEGMEYKVICGGKNLIEKHRPIVTFEIHLEIDKEQTLIYDYFNSNNYIVLLINEVLPGCRPDCRNFVAIPKERDLSCLQKYSETLLIINSNK